MVQPALYPEALSLFDAQEVVSDDHLSYGWAEYRPASTAAP